MFALYNNIEYVATSTVHTKSPTNPNPTRTPQKSRKTQSVPWQSGMEAYVRSPTGVSLLPPHVTQQQRGLKMRRHAHCTFVVTRIALTLPSPLFLSRNSSALIEYFNNTYDLYETLWLALKGM